ALLAVRAGLAWEAAEQPDSAAAAYGAARAAGLAAIDAWLRVRQARVTRDTATAFRLLADVTPPAAREVPVARARALLAAGDSLAALEAFAQAGRALDVGRLALARGEGRRARAAGDLSPRAHPRPPRRPGRPRSARGIRPVVSQRHGRADRALRARGHVRRPRRLGGRDAVVRRAGGALSRRRAGVAGALSARGRDTAPWLARQRGGAVPGGGRDRGAAAHRRPVLARQAGAAAGRHGRRGGGVGGACTRGLDRL